MQAITASRAFAGTQLSARKSVVASRPACRGVVSCQAQSNAKMAALLASVPAVLAAHPALAVVDERLGGEGTGKILGISSVEGWPVLIVFGLIWALYYASQKDLDNQSKGEGDDSGLSL